MTLRRGEGCPRWRDCPEVAGAFGEQLRADMEESGEKIKAVKSWSCCHSLCSVKEWKAGRRAWPEGGGPCWALQVISAASAGEGLKE